MEWLLTSARHPSPDARHPGAAVLDAGCGTGRVAIELARRGYSVCGVDIDPSMLDQARRKAPGLDWRLGDLATVDLGWQFDVIVLAGNVMLFVGTGCEGPVLANLARHLAQGGLIVDGFQLRYGLDLEDYDRLAAQAGLALRARWATWDRQPWTPGVNYAVSVHYQLRGRRPRGTGPEARGERAT